jgi:hypothetical protein
MNVSPSLPAKETKILDKRPYATRFASAMQLWKPALKKARRRDGPQH